MKLIIWWLALLTILPLLYLGWWKKGLRLFLGVTIVAILIASCFIPREWFSSLTQSEIENEIKDKVKKIDELINDASEQETNPENQEKVEKAKSIIKKKEKLKDLGKELEELKNREEKILEYQDKLSIYWHAMYSINSSKNEWVAEWSKEISSSAILFRGEDFNQTLTTRKYKIEGREVKLSENTIDFDDYQEKSVEEVKEKILEIIKKEEELWYEKFSVAFFKNINKIAKTEVKELLLTLFGQGLNANSWEYKKINLKRDRTIEEIDAIPNLSKFVFIASSSNSNSEVLEELRKNLRTVEAPLSKNKLIIFTLSGGLEIVIFFFLIRNKRKSQNEKLQQLDQN
jgi:hypothetical protein